jgi:hypothetical protein
MNLTYQIINIKLEDNQIWYTLKKLTDSSTRIWGSMQNTNAGPDWRTS